MLTTRSFLVVADIPEGREMPMAVNIFLAYARKDELSITKLESSLTRILQGDSFSIHKCEINQINREDDVSLSTADLILLLVSPDFLDSDYCYRAEMAQAIERHKQNDAYIIPLILRPVYWGRTPFSQLPALPENAKPIALSDDQEAIFRDIALVISTIVRNKKEWKESREKGEQDQDVQTGRTTLSGEGVIIRDQLTLCFRALHRLVLLYQVGRFSVIHIFQKIPMLARLWKDIQESWELYAAIGLCILFFFLGLFGFLNGMIVSLTLVVLAILAGSLRRQRGIETRIGKALQTISQDIHGLVTNQMFEEQEQAYQFLCDWIDKYGAKKAVLFQYSCNTSMNVVHALVRKGARVTVYIQHEDTATQIGSAFQAERITSRVRSLKGDLGKRLSTPDNLKFYKYRSPASVSAIKIDDRVLCMGWYLYEHQDQPRHPAFKNDTTEISAHDVAAIIAFSGTSEYNKLLKTFQTLEENFQTHAEEVQF